MDNFYVDDCLKSVATEDGAVLLVKQLCQLLSRGGFRLTKWTSNSKLVLDAVPPDERAHCQKNLDLDQSVSIERALGVLWNTDSDKFGIKIKPVDSEDTRRGVLKTLSSVYDPLGFVCPFVLRAKLIFQNECRLLKGWDEKLNEANKRLWSQWKSELSMLEMFEIDRCIKPGEFGNVLSYQLHHFCDASLDAYGTASYLRIVNENGHIHCAFMLGKSRLAPMRSVTIPRLELLAAVMAVKVDGILRREVRSLSVSLYFGPTVPPFYSISVIIPDDSKPLLQIVLQ